MKKKLLLLCLLAVTFSGNAQNVGINTITPQATLDVRGSQRFGGNNNYMKYDSASGKFEWIGTTLFTPVSRHIISHSASAEGLYAGGGKLEYRNQLGAPVFFSDWTSGNGYFAGTLGVGTITPQARLDVAGNVRTTGLTITSGGTESDFLIKNDVTGQVGFRKAHKGIGLNYIIAIEGVFPSSNPPVTNETYLGEIKLMAGNIVPAGWAVCHGQLLAVNSNNALFVLIGTTYGGNGVTTFALPDMRDAVPVGAGNNWTMGEKSN
ncbi:MAG: tail fiber protein [Chitinophagaceae bacterium]